MKREVSFDNYIAMCDRYAEAQFHCGAWWPSIIDIKTKLEPKLEQHLEFLIWITETADEPKTEQQRESQKYINDLLKNTIIFTDDKVKPQKLEQPIKENQTDCESHSSDDVELIFTEGE